MALYDTGLRLRRANGEMRRVLALTEDEMRGLRIAEILPDPQSDQAERAMAEVLGDGEPRYLEIHLRTAGEPRGNAWNVFLGPLRDSAGALRGVCLAAHDMTEQYWARQRLQLLNEAGLRIGTTLDVMRTAREVTEVVVPDLADYASVDLLESIYQGAEPDVAGQPESVLLRRLAHRSLTEGTPEATIAVGSVAPRPAHSPPAESLATGRPVVHRLTDPEAQKWIHADTVGTEQIGASGTHSVMAVPMRARGTTLGVLVLARHRSEPFEEEDVLLASEVAARAAVCIDNARRYTRERATALTLQRSLLPKRMPRQMAVEVASRYLPAGSAAGVGGDWFDVIPLSGARVGLVAGDIAGHGIQAAAAMGRLRTAVRTLADVDLPPDELLTHLDDLVARAAIEEEDTDGTVVGMAGATCLYAVYDPVSGTCTAARAGHPVPVLVGPGGDDGRKVRFLDLPAGPPLGLGGLPFESTEVTVEAGSLLVLYTNGLVEARDRDLDEGLTVLGEVLAHPDPTLEATCERILTSLLPDRPTGSTDDAALLLARTRVLDRSQVATWDLPAEASVVADARKAAAGQLAAWGLDEAEFTTELVVSELVTNAIRYGEAPIQLRLIHDRTLICEVSDGSNTAPHLRRARVFDEGGRGLLLVANLCRAWGTRQSSVGKTIWAEQELPVVP
jgi:PAS domain S-box-containing protein